MKFTTMYIQDGYPYSYEYGEQPEGFNTAQEAIKWNEERNIPIELVRMTEWTEENSSDGIPEILESGNLEHWKHKS